MSIKRSAIEAEIVSVQYRMFEGNKLLDAEEVAAVTNRLTDGEMVVALRYSVSIHIVWRLSLDPNCSRGTLG